MVFVLILTRSILAIVFGLAAITKLADRAGSSKAMEDFGLPRAMVRPLRVLLPLAELLVTFALLAPQSGWSGGVGAAVLLALFSAGIVFNLARGRKPDCHCFGQLHSEPVGWATLRRN